MKINFILFFGVVLSALLTSCDILPPEDDTTVFFNRLPIEKQFLLNEKWYYLGASVYDQIDNSDIEVRARNLRENVFSCELDNFMVFNSEKNDNLEVNFGSEICDNDTENLFDYRIDNSSETLTVGYLIGGFRNVTLSELTFSQEIENSTNKQIYCKFETIVEGEKVSINYSLINSILLVE